MKEPCERMATIREHMEVLKKQLDILLDELKEVEGEMARQGLDPSGSVNQVVIFMVAHRFFFFFIWE